jgi:hypothetical protein
VQGAEGVNHFWTVGRCQPLLDGRQKVPKVPTTFGPVRRCCRRCQPLLDRRKVPTTFGQVVRSKRGRFLGARGASRSALGTSPGAAAFVQGARRESANHFWSCKAPAEKVPTTFDAGKVPLREDSNTFVQKFQPDGLHERTHVGTTPSRSWHGTCKRVCHTPTARKRSRPSSD